MRRKLPLESDLSQDTLQPPEASLYLAERRPQIRIYLQPPTYDRQISGTFSKDEKPWTIVVVTDGTNRVGGDYDIGGKKVVEMAKKFAEADPGKISTMIAWILSEDNIRKRPDDFFQKIHQAFFILGLSILKEKELVSSGIRMEIAGDIEILRKNGGIKAEVASMIEEVCKLTHHLQNPRFTLKIGVGNNLGKADAIIRSATEKKDLARNSGLMLEPSYREIYVDDLQLTETVPVFPVMLSFEEPWPQIDVNQVAKRIFALQNDVRYHLYRENPGFFNVSLIRHVIDKTILNKRPADAPRGIIDIPYYPHGTAGVATIQSYARLLGSRTEKLTNARNRVEIYDHDEKLYATIGANDYDADRVYRVIPHNPPKQLRYDVVIALGQNDYIAIPPRLLGSYTQFWTAGIEPHEIGAAIHRSTAFFRSYKGLKGAQSNAGEDPREFDQYNSIQDFLAKSEYQRPSMEETFKRFAQEHSLEMADFNHRFSKMADFFVAKMLLWAERFGPNIFERLLEKRAFINYVFTSFFLTYYPNHKNWEALNEDWEKRAEFAARYMGLVFLMDEHIYDAETTDQDFRKAATPILIQAIKGEDANFTSVSQFSEEQKKWLQIVYAGYKELSRDLSVISHPSFYREWQEGMFELFRGSVREWDKHVLNSPLVDGLVENYEAFIPEFEQNHLRKKMPSFFRKKIEAALVKIKEGSSEVKKAAAYDLKQCLYFPAIEQTIGAKLTYMTLNCVNTKDLDVDPELVDSFHEVGTLINNLYRAANDFAESSRNKLDQDKKPEDSTTYIYKKHCLYTDNVIYARLLAGAEFKAFLEELDREIEQRQIDFFEKVRKSDDKHWKYLAMALLRTEFAMGFYKGTHYREARREKVDQLFQDHHHLVEF